VYARLAQNLELISAGVNKIATDLRLGARSGFTIYREPFGKKQKGSSAMPHKKNPIGGEQTGGMDRMVRANAGALVENCNTWEARAIEQSCVERTAWPDLFHGTLHALQTMNKIIRGLEVFPDVMIREIIDSRTTYASDEAKDFLAEKLSERGFEAEDAYRIVQLASFLAFRPSNEWLGIRIQRPMSLEDAGQILERAEKLPQTFVSMKSIIERGYLYPEESLDANEEIVARWNWGLQDLFSIPNVRGAWDNLFTPSHLLKYEHTLYEA
jgi:adenylosuccinate lyase